MNITAVIKCRKKYIKLGAAVIAAVLLAVFLSVGNSNSLEYKNYILPAQGDEISEEKVAFLTFDDGPSSVTDTLLDVLKENDVKATFFAVGETVLENNTERDRIFKRVVDEGHLLGLHTYSHRDYHKVYESSQHYVDGLLQLQKEMKDATGYESKVFRFPAGSRNNFCNRTKYKEIVAKTMELSMDFYDWNVDGRDAVGGTKSASTIANTVVKESLKLNYPVILLHDIPSCKTSTEAIPQIVKELKNNGYRFDTVDNLSIVVHQSVN